MVAPRTTIWDREKHTAAKHEILKRYLDAWFPIVSKNKTRVNYVDGYAGPGEYTDGEKGSPIIALERAAAFPNLNGEICFLFIEQDRERSEYLQKLIDGRKWPPNFRIHVKPGDFAEIFSPGMSLLRDATGNLAPTFVFVDPFGFQVPFEMLRGILRPKSHEILVHFMVQHINRFCDHPNKKTVAHIVEAFGTEECKAVAAAEGIQGLRNLYQERLESIAQFVRQFELRDRQDKTLSVLYFATNHPLGHVKMKESMWKADPEGCFRFSDAANPDQQVLFEEDPTERIARLLQETFKGKVSVPVSEIIRYIEDRTAFLERQMRAALKALEERRHITVMDVRSDGKPRHGKSFTPEVLIDFIPETGYQQDLL